MLDGCTGAMQGPLRGYVRYMYRGLHTEGANDQKY